MKHIMATALAVGLLAAPALAEGESAEAPLVTNVSSSMVMGDSLASSGGIVVAVLALVLIGAALHAH